jgi:DNA-binding CsgD family transcriptional regulator
MNAVQAAQAVNASQEAGGQEDLLLGVLHSIDYGVIVVDAAQTILIANHAAQATLNSERFLVKHGNRLEPRQTSQHTTFTQALQQAFGGKRRMFAMHDGDEAITCAMVPVLPAEYRASPSGLVMVSRPQVCQPLSVSLFAKDEGLSATETAVLNGLCNGLDPAEIAQNHGVAINTIRTQILSIRAKTQSPSIRALVQRLALLPPVLPALQQPVQ